MNRLPRKFYLQPTKTVAQKLLGKILCFRQGKKILKVRIVETEAYLGLIDPACHSYGGKRTKRTENFYRLGGHSYVYLIYGMYHCFNVVTGKAEHPEAILIRGVEPLTPLEMQTNGPGKLCKALGITIKENGLDLVTSKKIWLEEDNYKLKKSEIGAIPRVGIDYALHAVDWPLRFYIKENNFVSKIRN